MNKEIWLLCYKDDGYPEYEAYVNTKDEAYKWCIEQINFFCETEEEKERQMARLKEFYDSNCDDYGLCCSVCHSFKIKPLI